MRAIAIALPAPLMPRLEEPLGCAGTGGEPASAFSTTIPAAASTPS